MPTARTATNEQIWLGRRLDQESLAPEEELVAIGARTHPVHHQELARIGERNYRVMPGTASVVDPLPTIGHERADARGIHAVSGRSDHHEEGRRIEWHEELARQRMAFEEL